MTTDYQRHLTQVYNHTCRLWHNLDTCYDDGTTLLNLPAVMPDDPDDEPDGAPEFVFHYSIYVLYSAVTGGGDGTYYAYSILAPGTMTQGHRLPSAAAAEALEMEAAYFADWGVATSLATPFRLVSTFMAYEVVLERLRAQGYTELPNRNGGDNDYIYVDVRARQWIWCEGGCAVMNQQMLTKLHRKFPTCTLADFAELV